MKINSKFAVREKNTNKFFPEPTGRNGRGGSHTDPIETSIPRLFKSERSAKIFISSWRQGKFIAHRGYDNDSWESSPEYYEDIEIKKIPERLNIELEIVEIKLSIN